MPTIAIIGAGPGMGLAIARTFGSRGFDVALIARTKDKLQTLVDQLGQEGITAEAFPADVLDRPSLTAALGAIKARFGGIDVLEYSPAPHSPVPGHVLAAPSEVTVDNLQPQIEYLSTDDPIRVFQQLATAASLAPGRIELVAGRGSSTITFPLFDQDEHDYDVLYASKLDLLMAVNAGEKVTWHGPHRRRPLQDVTVFPRPEEPLKIWLGTGGSPDSVQRAVELGLPMFLGILGGTPEHWARYGHAYRDAWTASGHPAERADIAVAVHGFVRRVRLHGPFDLPGARAPHDGRGHGRTGPPRPLTRRPRRAVRPRRHGLRRRPRRDRRPHPPPARTARPHPPDPPDGRRRHAPARLPARHRTPRHEGASTDPRRAGTTVSRSATRPDRLRAGRQFWLWAKSPYTDGCSVQSGGIDGDQWAMPLCLFGPGARAQRVTMLGV